VAVPDEAITVFQYSLPSFVERLDQNPNLDIVEAASKGCSRGSLFEASVDGWPGKLSTKRPSSAYVRRGKNIHTPGSSGKRG